MRTNRRKLVAFTLGIATAAAGSGLPLAPTAHAVANCAVPGPHLDLRHSTGYDVTVDASGASLGPTAVVRTAKGNSAGTVTGGISGRVVDFTLNWPGTKAYVRYTGTVGNDGVAHGTSSSIASPVSLDAGPWDSVTHLTC